MFWTQYSNKVKTDLVICGPLSLGILSYCITNDSIISQVSKDELVMTVTLEQLDQEDQLEKWDLSSADQNLVILEILEILVSLDVLDWKELKEMSVCSIYGIFFLYLNLNKV